MDHEAPVFRRTIIAMISALNGGGTGILQDGVFSAVYAPERGSLGIAAYHVLPDGTLVSRGVGLGGRVASSETWTPYGGT